MAVGKTAEESRDSGLGQSEREPSPRSQFQEAAQNAHTLAADADLFREVFRHVINPLPAQTRLEQASAIANSNPDQAALPPSEPPHTAHHPLIVSDAQQHASISHMPTQHHQTEHPLFPQYTPQQLAPYHANQNYLIQQSGMPHVPQASRPSLYLKLSHTEYPRFSHDMQRWDKQKNVQTRHPDALKLCSQQESQDTPYQYNSRTQGPVVANSQGHQLAAMQPFNLTPQHTPSPLVTPIDSSSANASPLTSNVSATTPASTATNNTPNSNLAQKQFTARKHTRVQDVADPAICHLCFHVVVQKSSVKNHLVNVHGMKKEEVKTIDIYTKSELIAAGYQLPESLRPERILGNPETAAAAKLDSSSIHPKLKLPGTNAVADPVHASIQAATAAATNAEKSNEFITRSNPSGKTNRTAAGKRYTLNLNPPGLAAPAKVISSLQPFDATKALPPLGSVSREVTPSVFRAQISSRKPSESPVAPNEQQNASQRVGEQTSSVVPAKRTFDIANSPALQGSQNAKLHPAEITAMKKAGSGSIENSISSLSTPADTQSGIERSYVSGTKPNSASLPRSVSNVMPWLRDFGSQKNSPQELQDIARRALALLPDDLRHDSTGGNAGFIPGFLSQNLAVRDAVLKAVDSHEGSLAAASVQHELESMQWDGNSKVVQGIPLKRLKRSYGEIFVPETYVPDERLANVGRHEATAAEDDVEASIRIDRIGPKVSESKEAGTIDVQVWDDYDSDCDDSSEEGPD